MKRHLRSNLIIQVLILFSIAIGNAQESKISGKVSSKDGNPVIGASVLIKGTNSGTITDINGNFSFVAPTGSKKMIVSFIGMKTQEVLLTTSKNYSIILEDNSYNLDEVVAIGYGSVKKIDLTGSVIAVNMKDLEKVDVKSFDQALAGRVAGVTVTGNDGQPGSVNNIIVRGAGSITQDNSPLYVVDGFPIEDEINNTINPSDIESINVLKDASSTAIYGARGANGVVLITTKKGKSEMPKITFNSYFGFQDVAKRMNLLSPYEFVKYQLELNPTDATGLYLSDGKTLDYYKTVSPLDLQDYVYQRAPIQNYSISLRGGNDKTKYSVSGNAFNQQGVVINSGFKRYQGRINLEQALNKKTKTTFNLNYSYSKKYGVNPADIASNTSYSNNLFYAVWGYRPIAGSSADNLLDEYIDPALSGNVYSDYRVNPVISRKNEISNTISTTLMANVSLEYVIIPELTLKISGGITNSMDKEEGFYNSLTSRGGVYSTFGVNGSIYYSPRNTWLNENTLTYKKSIKRHYINIVGGYTMQAQTYGRYGFYANQVPNESLGLDGLDQAASTSSTTTSSSWGLVSFLGRANYSYWSKYLFTFSFRADGSSKFSPKNRWGYFPSASIAWNMNKESFLKKIETISEAKLRVSYGLTGNNRINSFGYLSQISLDKASGYSYYNQTTSIGAQLSTLGNPDLKWETTNQINIGYDFGMFENRIKLTADIYRKTTNDLLLLAQLPYTTGVSSAYKNVGKVRNDGLEISLNTINIQTRDFTWRSGFNISFNDNKVLELTENQEEILSSVSFDFAYNSLFSYTAKVGEPIAQMRGYVWDGIYQYSDFDKTESDTYVLKSTVTTNGNPRANIQPGDIKYKDLNGDLIVDANDITTIGRAMPIHTGGFVNDLTYKNFDLNIFLQWSYGNDILNANRLVFEGNGRNTFNLNQFASWANRWEPDNQSNTLFRTGGQGPYAFSSRVIEDGSYLRLKNVTLGYNFNKQLIEKLKISSLRLYCSAQNILTLTNYSGPDPEVSIRNSNLTPGFDYSAYPRARVFTFGFDAQF